jgi:hypothetical protein
MSSGPHARKVAHYSEESCWSFGYLARRPKHPTLFNLLAVNQSVTLDVLECIGFDLRHFTEQHKQLGLERH